MQAMKLPAPPTLPPPMPTALPTPPPVILISMALAYLLSLPLAFAYFFLYNISLAANKKQVNEKQDELPERRHML